MKASELVKMKNIDLSISEYNKEVEALNDEGFIDMNSVEYKKAKSKYESLIARFDTDIHIKKKDGKYVTKNQLYNTVIMGIHGLTKNVYIESEV
jgi:outer membrane protein assembly factor BamD (BamD/ComL family)